MKSMTGFGEAVHTATELQISVIVRSVNGRHLEIRPHLPKEYFSIEADLKKVVQGEVARATLDVFVNRRVPTNNRKITTTINQKLAASLFKSCNELRKNLKINDPISLKHILRWPEVVSIEIEEGMAKNEGEIVKKLLKMALKNCNDTRLREGKALASEVKKILFQLRDLVVEIKELARPNQQQVRQQIEERWKGSNISGVDETRLAQETVIFIDRMDVTEELVRLIEHISAVENLLGESGSIGKRLEFFCQELLREINTVGSKSQKFELTRLVVESKGCIERLREQVQNIE